MSAHSPTGYLIRVVPAAALCGFFTVGEGSITESVGVLPVSSVPVCIDATLAAEAAGNFATRFLEPISDLPATTTELAAWAQRMMGGDTTNMLDI
jgi:hypothetical protein